MNKNLDNPDTFVMEDQTEWEATQVDDVFLPSVQVLIGWREVEAAVERGAIVPAEAHGLWASWAAPGSPLRRMGQAVEHEQSYRSTQPEDTEMDELPSFQSQSGGGMKPVIMLLVGVVVGAALMFAVGP